MSSSGGAGDAVLHGALVVAVGRVAPGVVGVSVRDSLLGQFPALVGEVDEPHLGRADHLRPLPVCQQPVVGPPDQEIVEPGSGHQALDRLPETGQLAAAHGGELGLCREPAGEQQGRAAQGLRGRGHRHACEERVRRQDPGVGLAAQSAQKALHVGEVHGAGNHLDAPAVAFGSLDLVEDQVGTASTLSRKSWNSARFAAAWLSTEEGASTSRVPPEAPPAT